MANILSREQELKLADLIAGTWWDPLLYAQIAFPWGKPGTFLADHDGPDEFQTGVLEEIGRQLRAIANGTAPSNTIRIAVSSGHGVGKTALMAIIELWWQSTRPNSKSITTAGTKTQLTTKTWRELEKWRQVAINGHWFKWTATALKAVSSPVTWAAEAIPWSDSNPQAFAGTHEQWVMYKFDEASTISDSIWETSEGAFTTEGPHLWLAFGNPEQPIGRFRECWTRHRNRWITIEVDARKSRFANKQLLQEWIDTYGEDSDFVRVRVKGQPPKTPPEQFISTEALEQCEERWPEVAKNEKKIPRGIPLLMGVDPGAGGQGKTTIVFRRGGFVYKNILRSSEADQTKVAGIIAQAIRDYKPAICFIDAHGIGWGVYNILQQLQFKNVIPCFAGDTKHVNEPQVYFNQRCEWWARMREWMKTGALPHDAIMREDLLAPKRLFNTKMLMLVESKEVMKLRGIPSPDTADALALTFALPVPSAQEMVANDQLIEDGMPVEPEVEASGTQRRGGVRKEAPLLDQGGSALRCAEARGRRCASAQGVSMRHLQRLSPHKQSAERRSRCSRLRCLGTTLSACYSPPRLYAEGASARNRARPGSDYSGALGRFRSRFRVRVGRESSCSKYRTRASIHIPSTRSDKLERPVERSCGRLGHLSVSSWQPQRERCSLLPRLSD